MSYLKNRTNCTDFLTMRNYPFLENIDTRKSSTGPLLTQQLTIAGETSNLGISLILATFLDNFLDNSKLLLYCLISFQFRTIYMLFLSPRLIAVCLANWNLLFPFTWTPYHTSIYFQPLTFSLIFVNLADLNSGIEEKCCIGGWTWRRCINEKVNGKEKGLILGFKNVPFMKTQLAIFTSRFFFFLSERDWTFFVSRIFLVWSSL